MTDNARRADSLDKWTLLPKASPDEAAERIIRGIARNEPRILIGKDARAMDILQRLKPGTYWSTIARKLDKATARMTSARTTGDK